MPIRLIIHEIIVYYFYYIVICCLELLIITMDRIMYLLVWLLIDAVCWFIVGFIVTLVVS